jgi:2-haloacid dehalogenase
LRVRPLAAYRRLTLFADVVSALEGRRELGMRTSILSNGSAAMLAEGLAADGIAELVDPVLSIDEAGVFEPAPEVCRLATSQLDLPAAAIAFGSANGWEVHEAASVGPRSIRVNRGRLADDRQPAEPAAVIDGLARLLALLVGQRWAPR